MTLALLLMAIAAPVSEVVQDTGVVIRELKAEERDLLETLDRVIDEKRSLERRARSVTAEMAELNRSLAREAQKLQAEEKAVQRALLDARVRLRQLDTMLRGQSLRFVLGAESFSDGIRRTRVVERGFRRDAQMVTRTTRLLQARERKTKELDKKRLQVGAMLAALDEVKRSIVDKSAELQATLLQVREKRSLEERAYYDLRDFQATLQKESEEDAIAAKDAFVRLRGALAWPVDKRFCDPSEDQRGLKCAAPDGTSVVAVHGGKIAYANDLDGYGGLVVVKHSDNYFGVYSGLRALAVKVGDVVLTQTRLGLAAASGIAFELRRRSVVEEASKWLGK